MKRIYENIPVQSVLYEISGLQRVVIRNFPNQDSMYYFSNRDSADYGISFDGMMKDFRIIDYGMNRVAHAKVRGISIGKGEYAGAIVIDICLLQDRYDDL